MVRFGRHRRLICSACGRRSNSYCIGTMAIPAGALPAANGEPEIGVNAPVDVFTENAEMVLSILLATNKNLPEGSSATAKGCWPVDLGAPIADRDPLFMLNADTLLAPT